jgi:hypothetical protein
MSAVAGGLTVFLIAVFVAVPWLWSAPWSDRSTTTAASQTESAAPADVRPVDPGPTSLGGQREAVEPAKAGQAAAHAPQRLRRDSDVVPGESTDENDAPAPKAKSKQAEADKGDEADEANDDKVESGKAAGGKSQTGSGQVGSASAGGGAASYLLKNVKTGYCMDLPGTGKGAADGKIGQNNCSSGSGDNQEWELVQVGSQVQIRNLKDKLCVDLPGTGNIDPGSLVSEFPCVVGTGDNQMFTLKKVEGGYYLRHVKSTMCLEVHDAGSNINSPLGLWHCFPDNDDIWALK